MSHEHLDQQLGAVARGATTKPAVSGFLQSSHWKWLPDLLALIYSLALAWVLKWQVKDLVWSLWLSSFVVGYATILFSIFGPLFRRDGLLVSLPPVIKIVGALFMTVFFTVHFSGFHFVHSVFLNVFFPVGPRSRGGLINPSVYWTVLATYWPFVLATAISERAALLRALRGPGLVGSRSDGMMAPYKNVIRMHLLIFFFAATVILKVQSFLIYAVVLCVYFFPFRHVAELLKQRRTP